MESEPTTQQSAFTSSWANATTLTTFVAWLEGELCAERQALGLALQERHESLLNEVIPRLQAAKECRTQLPHCTSIHPALLAAGNANPKIVWVSQTSLHVPIGERHHAPPAEPSSPSSSFLIEDQVPENGDCALSKHVNAGPDDDAPELDEHIVQTSLVNDVGAGDIGKPVKLVDEPLFRFPPDKNNVPVSQTTLQSNSRSIDSCKTTLFNRTAIPRTLTQEMSAWGSVSSAQEARAAARGMGWLARIVVSGRFEAFFAVLILLNTLTMAAEAQYRGIDAGFALGYDQYGTSASDNWPGADTAFNVLEWFFGVAFTLHVVLKLLCMWHDFFCEFWNLLDTFIVGAWLFSSLSADKLIFDPMVLRLARLARLLRLMVLVRTIQLFDALYLMTTAIKASLLALMWSIMLLVLFLVMMGLLLQKLAEPYVLDDGNPLDGRSEVFMYYGTFARSILTMFEITLGNWMPPCRALVEHVSEWFMLLILTHKLVIGFSVVSVINAVFMQETFKVATSDTRIMLMTRERARKVHLEKIKSLFGHADEDGDGRLSFAEFHNAFDDPLVTSYVSALDLDIHEYDRLFDMIDLDGDGTITLHELSAGMSRLRGTAKSYDVRLVLSYFRDMEERMTHLNHALAS